MNTCCPYCNSSFEAPVEYAGRQIKCPVCKKSSRLQETAAKRSSFRPRQIVAALIVSTVSAFALGLIAATVFVRISSPQGNLDARNNLEDNIVDDGLPLNQISLAQEDNVLRQIIFPHLIRLKNFILTR